MSENIELETNPSWSLKTERHLAAIRTAVAGQEDRETEARMEVIRHKPSDQEERRQKLIYVVAYLLASKEDLTPEEVELVLRGPTSVQGH
ncbi:hypothetical protein [Mycoplana rhizolycopersici]|jgi:DNA-binding NarL/FixJ family response regulator|uniref:Uncharacterized protein n=1 Tax=Mycoplana rhizolycopersici TaxID=2746702 RepID=A0ABX2QIZ4_9HYPH|nr:hypothetical protein [Rhizobium rhizolycopersici]NVP57727.1 hypothetical protein [Rhizobium rhizolycopersici]